VLLAVEILVLVPIAAFMAWAAIAPNDVSLTAIALASVGGAAILVFVAWLAVPEDTSRPADHASLSRPV
jgi:hypothetical protein